MYSDIFYWISIPSCIAWYLIYLSQSWGCLRTWSPVWWQKVPTTTSSSTSWYTSTSKVWGTQQLCAGCGTTSCWGISNTINSSSVGGWTYTSERRHQRSETRTRQGVGNWWNLAGLDCEGRSVRFLHDLGQGGGGNWSRSECHLHSCPHRALHHDLSPHLHLLQTWPGEGAQSVRSYERWEWAEIGETHTMITLRNLDIETRDIVLMCLNAHCCIA